MTPFPRFYDDLAETLAECWRCLCDGAVNRESAFHTPCLATCGLDGAPQLRTVVLRAVDPLAAWLQVHSDPRTAKIGEVWTDPRCAIHAYSPADKVQLRMAARAEVMLEGDIVTAAWDRAKPMSRHCYQVTAPPGTAVDDPGAVVFDAAATGGGRANFAVIRLHVSAIEWLYLEHRGHRRARFVKGADGTFEGSWLVP